MEETGMDGQKRYAVALTLEEIKYLQRLCARNLSELHAVSLMAHMQRKADAVERFQADWKPK